MTIHANGPFKRAVLLLALLAVSGYLMAAEIEGYMFLVFFLAVFVAALYVGFRKKQDE